MSELLGVKISLGVAGVDVEPEPWVCSRHRYKLKGTCASGSACVCVSLVSMGIPLMLGGGENVVASTMILTVSELQCSWVNLISWKSSFLCDSVLL